MSKHFSKIYEEQERFQNAIMQTYGIAGKEDKQKFIKDLLIHLNAETLEVLEEINWKMHKRALKTVDELRLLHEMVDVIKYALALPASWGFTAEQVERVIIEKNAVVLQRFQQEIINKDFSEHDKVVGVDIDGVLLQYPEFFVDYAYTQLGKPNPHTFVMKKYNLYNELAKHLGMSEDWLRQVKHHFRASGEKRNMPAYPGAAEKVRELRAAGYKVILLSARPTRQYPSLFYDTIESLKAAGIAYDGIYFSENKEEEIMLRFPNIIAFVEDCTENAQKIIKIGKKVFLVDKTYNQDCSKKAIRIKTVADLKIKEINGGE